MNIWITGFDLRYQEGMLRARVQDKETIQLIEGATLGMMATIEAQGEGAVQDWEVQDKCCK